eukprot:scaffold11431_cov118-Isochrysis_galbana.AAC.12
MHAYIACVTPCVCTVVACGDSSTSEQEQGGETRGDKRIEARKRKGRGAAHSTREETRAATAET